MLIIKRIAIKLPEILRLPVLFMISYVLLILVFGASYYFSRNSFEGSRECELGLGLMEAMYFSVVTITTLGYGEILPVNWWGQLLVICETLLGIFCLGLLLTSIGYSLGARHSRIQREENDYARIVKSKTGVLRLAAGIQTFLERYDDDKAPMGMSGGTGYFFRDAGSIMSRSITFPDHSFKYMQVNHVNVDVSFATSNARAIEGYLARLEGLLAQHRSDISKFEIIDSVNAHLHFCRRQIEVLDSLDLPVEGSKNYVENVISNFDLVISSSSGLLVNLLNESDYTIDGSTLRYVPDPHAAFEEKKANGFWIRLSNYLGF